MGIFRHRGCRRFSTRIAHHAVYDSRALDVFQEFSAFSSLAVQPQDFWPGIAALVRASGHSLAGEGGFRHHDEYQPWNYGNLQSHALVESPSGGTFDGLRRVVCFEQTFPCRGEQERRHIRKRKARVRVSRSGLAAEPGPVG